MTDNTTDELEKIESPHFFGLYSPPFQLEMKDIVISTELINGGYLYRRISVEGTIEKMIGAEKVNVLIQPVEPVSKPNRISSNLLVEFEKSMIIEPKIIQIAFPRRMVWMSDPNTQNNNTDLSSDSASM